MTQVWKNRDFVWLVSGQTVSEFGSSIVRFALPWLILQMTNSAFMTGLAGSIGFLPYLLLSLPAGVWADRFDRKKLMIIADAGRMLLILSVPLAHFLGMLTVVQLLVVEAGMSAFSALFDASYVSCLPNVVGRESLQQANSIIQTGMAASQVLGPPLAGVLVSFIGAPTTITVNALSFLISVVSLYGIRVSFSASRTNERGRAKQGMLAGIKEGLVYVWQHRLIRTISLFTMVMNIGGSATGAVILFRVKNELHVGSDWAGLVMIGYSIGTILGSISSGFFSKRLPMGRIMSTMIILQIVPAFLIGWTHLPLLITLSYCVIGFSGANWNVQSLSLRQSVIPDSMLGRASSSIRMIVWGSIPVGSIIGGAVGQVYGASSVFYGEGVLAILLCVWGLMTPLFKTKKDALTVDSAGTASAEV